MAKEKILAEQVDVLFDGIEVTTEQKEKFTIKLEAVLTEKARLIEDDITTKKNEEVATGITEATDLMEENINKYLEYVVKEWMEDNKLAVDVGLKAEIAENFISGLKGLFESAYIDMPEGKQDILAATEDKVAILTTDLNKSIESNTEMKIQIETFERGEIVNAHTSGLTATQVEKLTALVEDIEYNDKATYDIKVKHIRESFFKADDVTDTNVNVSDSVDDTTSERMKKYINAL